MYLKEIPSGSELMHLPAQLHASGGTTYPFSQRTINVWNKLSTDCVHASIVMFKNRIDKYLVKAGYSYT